MPWTPSATYCSAALNDVASSLGDKAEFLLSPLRVNDILVHTFAEAINKQPSQEQSERIKQLCDEPGETPLVIRLRHVETPTRTRI
jgi:hypothetical protein